MQLGTFVQTVYLTELLKYKKKIIIYPLFVTAPPLHGHTVLMYDYCVKIIISNSYSLSLLLPPFFFI